MSTRTKSARGAICVFVFVHAAGAGAGQLVFVPPRACARVANKLLPLREFPDAFIVRPADLI